MPRNSRRRIFVPLLLSLLGAGLLLVGAAFSYYRPPVEYAKATETETAPDTAPAILMAAGAGVLATGAILLWRRSRG